MDEIETRRQRATYEDIYRGKSANGLVWNLDSGGINYRSAPTEDSFYTRDGCKFLRSASWERKGSRQKDRPPRWCTAVYENADYAETEDGEFDVFTWETPAGTAIGRRHQNHFVEYPLKSVDDLDVWIHVYENLRFTPTESWLEQNDPGQATTLALSWSPVQQLIQFDMGLENLYYFLMDAPDKMAALLEVMQERCMDRLRLGLSLLPNASVVYWGENTSSSSISPPYYEKHTLPHIQAYARLIHQNGKRLVVHMCGLLKDLLDQFVLTEMDGIHSATPPPIGDTPYRLIRDKFEPDFTIIGRLNAQLWVGKDKDVLQANVRSMIYPDLLHTPFALMVTTDAIPDIPKDDVMVLFDALETMSW